MPSPAVAKPTNQTTAPEPWPPTPGARSRVKTHKPRATTITRNDQDYCCSVECCGKEINQIYAASEQAATSGAPPAETLRLQDRLAEVMQKQTWCGGRRDEDQRVGQEVLSQVDDRRGDVRSVVVRTWELIAGK